LELIQPRCPGTVDRRIERILLNLKQLVEQLPKAMDDAIAV
jgi:hypothetical protein